MQLYALLETLLSCINIVEVLLIKLSQRIFKTFKAFYLKSELLSSKFIKTLLYNLSLIITFFLLAIII